MIIMLMGHQDGTEITRHKTQTPQATLAVFQGKTTIHQQSGIT
jgi:hypothetical protein